QLPRHDALVAFLADPAHVPLRKPGQLAPRLARGLEARRLSRFFGCLFRDLLLDVRKVRVVIVADRAHRQAARAVAEGTDHAQQALPEAEQLPRAQRRLLLLGAEVEETVEEIGHRHIAEFLRLGGAGALVEPPLSHGVRRARVHAAAARLADADLL